MRKLVILLAIMCFSAVLPADVIMNLTMPRQRYMVYEPVIANLALRNTSGQGLIFGHEAEFKGHLEIGLFDMNNRPLKGSGTKIELKGLILRPGADQLIRLNIGKWLDMRRAGFYKLKVYISHPMLKNEYESNFCTFDITLGQIFWQRKFGIPNLQGAQLSLMVFTWAQLGYVLVHVKKKRVLLYKQMDMGNERSAAERRWFKKLFAKGSRVDTTDYRYASLCRAAAKKQDRAAERMKQWNGNPLVFRVLTAGIGFFGGVGIAVAMADGAALQGLLMVLFGILGAVSGWYMQLIGYGLLLRDARCQTTGLIHVGIWLLLSILAGDVGTGLLLVTTVLALSLLLAWGGRRTQLGRLVQMQTLGFARYLRTADKKNLQRICSHDPMYFFRLAPAALALGMEKTFAKKFGDLRLEGCPYLTTGMDGHMTAMQWSIFMRRTVNKMNDRANGLWLEKLLQILAAIKKG